MGDEHEPTQRVLEDAGPTAAHAPATAAAPDITVPAADPFASTLTVAAGPSPSAPKLEPGRELGPVRLVREIGRGATGTVYQGHHTVLGRDVAVKFLMNVSAGPGDVEGLRRFVDEARAAASVRHPNLTQVFHADLDGTTPYLVLEYVPGPTLRQLLDHAGDLGVPVTAAILSDVAAALAELHSRGIIHRDVKPSNVLVDNDGRVFVTDFGLALRRSLAGHGSSAAEIDFAGTPAYMAGEMFEGRVSSRSDVYAMGVMAFQLLSGTTPFSGTFHELREKHRREPLPSEALRGRGVKAEVVEIIERATNKQAMFRYKTAPDFARAFRDAAGCGMPELARARKRLCDLVIARSVGVPSGAEVGPGGNAGGGGGGALTGEVRFPNRSADADDDSGSSLYTETISRIATLKRERRRYPFADADGSSTGLPAVPPELAAGAPAARFAAPPVAIGEGIPAPAETRAVARTPVEESNRAPGEPLSPPREVPGAVLSVGLMATVYGTLAAAWQVGVVFGATAKIPELPPASESTLAVYLFLVPAALAHALLTGLMVPAAVACLGLRRWGRRFIVGLSAANVALQAGVLLLALAWVGPVTVDYIASLTPESSPADRPALEASIVRQWLFQWVVLSVFPAIVLAVMTRPRVRTAFDAAAAARERATFEDDDSEPLF